MTHYEHSVPAAWGLCCLDGNTSQEAHSPLSSKHSCWNLLDKAQLVAVVSMGQGWVVCLQPSLLLSLLNTLPKRESWTWIIRISWQFHRSPFMAIYRISIFSLRTHCRLNAASRSPSFSQPLPCPRRNPILFILFYCSMNETFLARQAQASFP